MRRYENKRKSEVSGFFLYFCKQIVQAYEIEIFN